MAERQVQLIDIANTEGAFRAYGYVPVYTEVRDTLEEDRKCIACFAYVPINPWFPQRRDRLIRLLEDNRFIVRTKMGVKRPDGNYKCDMDVEMARDALRIIWQGNVNVLTVACGDCDLGAVYEEARSHGISDEMASTREASSARLRQEVSRFIDLGELIREQPANHEGVSCNGHALEATA